MSQPRIVIVVPAYNEALRLDVAAFAAHAGARPGHEFLFVDDASTDATPEIVERLCTAHPATCASVGLERNGGKAEAVRQGLNTAIARGAGIVGYLDADLATPLSALDGLVRELTERPDVALAMGARVKLLGRHIERKMHRHYLGRVFATFVSLVLDLPVYDTQCGAKVMRVTPALRKALAEPFASRWIFDVELLARLAQELGPLDQKVVEVPLDSWVDVAGSKLRTTDFFRAAVELIGIWRRYRTTRQAAGDAPPASALSSKALPSSVRPSAR